MAHKKNRKIIGGGNKKPVGRKSRSRRVSLARAARAAASNQSKSSLHVIKQDQANEPIDFFRIFQSRFDALIYTWCHPPPSVKEGKFSSWRCHGGSCSGDCPNRFPPYLYSDANILVYIVNKRVRHLHQPEDSFEFSSSFTADHDSIDCARQRDHKKRPTWWPCFHGDDRRVDADGTTLPPLKSPYCTERRLGRARRRNAL